MPTQRISGMLLHPTSLPGPFGIGDFGGPAYRFLDWLAEAGQGLWQVLPLGPTGYGDSPYQAFSSFAGNPLLVDPQGLLESGLLTDDDLAAKPDFPVNRTDYRAVDAWKSVLFQNAHARFQADHGGLREAFDAFCAAEAHWLDDYALFMALKAAHGGVAWTEWPEALVQRHSDALDAARRELAGPIERCKLIQFFFYRQWDALRRHAAARGIRIIGDIPIYVAHDSADVWVDRTLFALDSAGRPSAMGGVPPDYFSATGQLWGNPVYRWERHAETGYAWWCERVRAALRLVDIVRIDHFRGFEAYWEVPAGHTTAEHGRWVQGPGDGLFHALQGALGAPLPIIAENLGVITPEVEALRERFGMPGMAVFQFGFGRDAATSGFPPHAYVRNLAAYTGTHDNDTTRGWWKSGTVPEVKAYIKKYLATSGRDIHWTAIRTVLASVADWAIFPLQDALGLGSAARINRPGHAAGNWQWRAEAAQLTPELAAKLRDLAETYGRAAPQT